MTINEFINRMMLLYGAPDSADDAAFLAEIRSMLRGLSEAVLSDAIEVLKKSHLRSGWPAPGVIWKACEKVIEAKNIGAVSSNSWQRQLPPVPKSDYDEETKERWRAGAEFQEAMEKKHGSFDAYLTATAHQRDGGKRLSSRSSSFKTLSTISKRITGERP